MARCIFIVQGEGRGHLSQAMSMKEYLEDAGHSVEAVFVGMNTGRDIPDYFLGSFTERPVFFHSPSFLRTPNKKGIYIGKTLLFNLLHSISYIKEVRRLRSRINHALPDLVFNFYDLIGALALRKADPSIKRIGVGHHFFLHMDGYRCKGGSFWHRCLLKIHTRQVMQSCDRILALSFSPAEGDSKMRVIPPLIRRKFRSTPYKQGERYLAYFLHEGFIYDLIVHSRFDTEFKVDVFTRVIPGIDLPPNLVLHPVQEEKFREKLAACKGLITNAGFDTVAEAAYLGLPVAVIPIQHHFEQRCNSRDMERAGMGIVMRIIEQEQLSRLRTFNNQEFRTWVDRAEEIIINIIEE